MVTIERGPVWSRITQAPPDALRAVYDALTVENPQARFSRAFRYGRWDGSVKFLLRPHNRFLAGLTPRVIRVASEVDPEVRVLPADRVLPRPPLAPALAGAVEDRAYQADAIEAFGRAGGRATLQIPTGGGKTLTAMEIIRRYGQPTLWLTHLKDLFEQTAGVAARVLPGVPIGKLGAGISDPRFPITVAMVQTLKDVPDGDPFWDAWRLVVFDECHRASAMTWFDVSKRLRYAPYRLGLSGTASTKDEIRDMRLEGVTGPTVKVVSSGALVEAGYLARPTIRLLRAPAESYPVGKQFPGDGARRFAAAYDAGVVLNGERNMLVVAVALEHARAGEKVLVLARRIPHGQDLERLVRLDRGTPVKWISGQESLDVRRGALRTFRERVGGGILIASTIFDEGVDIPEIDVLVLAGAGQSTVRTMQRLGRALRPRRDKTEVVVYDFLDGRAPYHPKWRPRQKGVRMTYDDYLAQHALERIKDYEAEGFAVEWPA